MNEQEKCGITFKSTTRHEQSDARLLRAKRHFKRLLKLADYERQLIAYEIHDGLAQQLAGAIMEFEAFDHDRASCPEDAGRAYTAAMRLLRQGLCEARRLIAASRPPMLDESGVVGRHCQPSPRLRAWTEDQVPQRRQIRPTGPRPGKYPLSHRPGSLDERLPAQSEQADSDQPSAERKRSRAPGSTGLGNRPRSEGGPQRPTRAGGHPAAGATTWAASAASRANRAKAPA